MPIDLENSLFTDNGDGTFDDPLTGDTIAGQDAVFDTTSNDTGSTSDDFLHSIESIFTNVVNPLINNGTISTGQSRTNAIQSAQQLQLQALSQQNTSKNTTLLIIGGIIVVGLIIYAKNK